MSAQYPVVKGTLHSSESFTWNTADSLGRGASAVVYLGRNKLSGQVVAVKVFHQHLLGSSANSSDLSELNLLRQLNHPNIISLMAIEKEMGSTQPVLVMEYCEGGSLHHMLDQPQYYYGLDEEMFLLVLTNISAGMQYLRRQNIIHRDIKPGNIMRFISTDGETVFKLTDFGAARSLDEDESFHSLYGTEEYLHPRIYERAVLRTGNNPSFNANVDLWSLGVTLYHTATGQLPFNPFGGRNNRHTMFDIITTKERGTLSGVQTRENGPIEWSSELPDSCPLSSGLKALLIPILAGLMEPNETFMITYDVFFNMVDNMTSKMAVHVFYANHCENLVLYVEKNTVLSSLQDEIAGKTDIVASDQILLAGGKSLEEVINPELCVEDYPSYLLEDSIFLFHASQSEGFKLSIPKIPAFPEIAKYNDMDLDSRHAHSCSARSELIKRYVEFVCKDQERLVRGMHFFRVYIEGLLQSTKPLQNLMQDLLSEFKSHCDNFFSMVQTIQDLIKDKYPRDCHNLEVIHSDNIIRPVQTKALERITEIKHYCDLLEKKMDEIRQAAKMEVSCTAEKCVSKVTHHVGVVSMIQNRFRRDKNVKHQMTSHDESIHGFERQKLLFHCASLNSILTGHCYPARERLFLKTSQVYESLSKCQNRVCKVEKNIKSVLNCEKLLSEKMNALTTTCQRTLTAVTSYNSSGYHSAGADLNSTGSQTLLRSNYSGAGPDMVSMEDKKDSIKVLGQKLQEVQDMIMENSATLKSFEEPISALENS